MADPVRLLDDFSIEITRRDSKALEACRRHLPAGSEVFITFVHGDSHDQLADAAGAVAAAGFRPVPHIAARSLSDLAAADRLAGRLSERGVEDALILAGDVKAPAGPFDSSLDLLNTGVFERHGFRRLGFAFHPEGHPQIADGVMHQALWDKLAWARDAGVAPWLVSQFGFDAAPFLATLRRFRDEGVTAPVRVGLAGPASRATLLRYAAICGVGASIRFLGNRTDSMGKLMTRYSPMDVVAPLDRGLRSEPDLIRPALHLFPFGGVAETCIWALDHRREPALA
jgi:methylenetetrahydrofolate reductase (NADPH)